MEIKVIKGKVYKNKSLWLKAPDFLRLPTYRDAHTTSYPKKRKNPTIIMDRHFNFTSHEAWGWKGVGKGTESEHKYAELHGRTLPPVISGKVGCNYRCGTSSAPASASKQTADQLYRPRSLSSLSFSANEVPKGMAIRLCRAGQWRTWQKAHTKAHAKAEGEYFSS